MCNNVDANDEYIYNSERVRQEYDTNRKSNDEKKEIKPQQPLQFGIHV